MSLKTWLMTGLLAFGAKNVSAQGAPVPQPDGDSPLKEVKTPEIKPNLEDSVSVAPWQNVQETDTSEIKQKPAVDISKVAKKEQDWAKSDIGQETINAYRDAVESLLPNKKVTKLKTEDVFFLRLLYEQTDSCIGSYPNSTLEYDPRDLLEMDTGELGAQKAEIAKQYRKSRNNGKNQCTVMAKQVEGMTCRLPENMLDIEQAYQMEAGYKNSPNHSIREVKNGFTDTQYSPEGLIWIDRKGNTPSGHIFPAGNGDEMRSIIIDGKKYDYPLSVQYSDYLYGFNSTGRRGSKQHYGKPCLVADNEYKIGMYTRLRELGNPAVEEYRHFTPLAKEADVSEFVDISPKKMYKQFTKNKQALLTKFNCDNNGKPKLITEMRQINWIKERGGWGGSKAKKSYKRSSQSRRGGNRRV